MLRERTRAEKFVARAYVPKWAGKGDRGGITSLADRRCPDSELQVRRYVTRPGVNERDRDFAGISVYRRCWLLDVPDGLEDTSRAWSSPVGFANSGGLVFVDESAQQVVAM